MADLIFDSHAFMTLFRKEPGWEIVRDLITDVSRGRATGWISAINIGGVYYMTVRKSSEIAAVQAMEDIDRLNLRTDVPGYEVICRAAALKSRHPISYADAFAAELTIRLAGKVITGKPNLKVCPALQDLT